MSGASTPTVVLLALRAFAIRLADPTLCPLARLTLPLFKSSCGIGPRTGDADRLAAKVAAISDGDEVVDDDCMPPSKPNLPTGGGNSVLPPPLPPPPACNSDNRSATKLLCACPPSGPENPAASLPLLLPPVAWRLTPPEFPFPASPADLGRDAACSLAACVAASKAPLPPRNPVPCAAAAAAGLGFVPMFCPTGCLDGEGPRPMLLPVLPPATAAFFCLLKARVAPCRAAETAGLAFPAGVPDKAGVEDVAEGVAPRPCVWLVRVGDGGRCMWKVVGV